jgi:hypothetical protein
MAHLVQRIAAVVACVFGIATIMAGTRVLTGADPGYLVFRPLLIFNTLMGVVYIAAGVATWLSVRWGRSASAAVFSLNLLVLVAIIALYRSGDAVAVDSVRAMSVRTVVWLALYLSLVWAATRSSSISGLDMS